MSERLIEKIALPNGLILEIWDTSHLMAGDRWLVSLLAKVEVTVLPEYFSPLDDGEQAYQDLVAAHGNSLVFTQEKVRLFVDKGETKEVLTRLRRSIKDNLAAYLGNPKFASSYVLKKYGDLRDRQNWGAAPPSPDVS
ncbi:MAG: hypothetical protein LJE87_14095 [Deltaproteobacteria bacterium]|nr:hypothetical protein [Deltaproteobacteria bacterium]